MRSFQSHGLTGPALAVALTCVALICSFAQEIQAPGPGSKTEARNAKTLPSTDNELASFLKEVQQSPEDLGQDSNNNIISLVLRPINANDRTLSLVSRVGSLQELIIQGRGRPETGEWGREGIASLGKLTNLTALRVICVSPWPGLQTGAFEQICELKTLRSLRLVAACPDRSEYAALTNLQNLIDLQVSYATNFGDAELCLITNLAKLKSLCISFDTVSRSGTNVLSAMHLTNAAIRLRRAPP